jgi:hypothetical protein
VTAYQVASGFILLLSFAAANGNETP